METGTVISIGALIVAFIGLILNSRKETRSDAAAMAKIETALNTANVGISDIRVDLRSMRSRFRIIQNAWPGWKQRQMKTRAGSPPWKGEKGVRNEQQS